MDPGPPRSPPPGVPRPCRPLGRPRGPPGGPLGGSPWTPPRIISLPASRGDSEKIIAVLSSTYVGLLAVGAAVADRQAPRAESQLVARAAAHAVSQHGLPRGTGNSRRRLCRRHRRRRHGYVGRSSGGGRIGGSREGRIGDGNRRRRRLSRRIIFRGPPRPLPRSGAATSGCHAQGQGRV